MDEDSIEKKPQRLQPRAKSSILSKLFYCWALPLFCRRYKKEITEDEQYKPLKSHESKRLGDKLEAAWLKEAGSNLNPNASLWKALWKTFFLEFLCLGFLFICSEFFIKMSQPWLIGKLMSQYNSSTSISQNDVYLYSSLILLNNFLSVMVGHNYQLYIQHLGMKVRIACCSLIYRKALKLDKTSLAELTVGKMINLITNDVNRFDLAVMHVINLFVAPFETAFVIWCLYVTVGLTSIAGIAFLILFVPLQMYMGKLTSVFRSRTATKTDQRVKLMNEIISGIQVIKMYTWENLFKKLITKARRAEIRQITYLSYLRAINSSSMMFMNRTGIFLCILIYALTENKIDAQYVFVVSSFYAILRQTLTVYFPFGINSFSEARVSVNRIRKFLISTEIPTENQHKVITTFVPTETKEQLVKQHSQTFSYQEDGRIGICLQNVSVKWIQSSENYTLHNVNFEASSGELVAIIGPVGSGKSTLLYTILQELPLKQGTVKINGTVSYAAQEPWLFSGTIRQNILFGSSFDKSKYEKVISVCGLMEDFSVLPYGDDSKVGERGVMLSGGQKARISLARAVYKDADIYLLDDPFAAVDTKVGKEIFEECVLNYLKNKCTVLVTHHLRYLGTAKKIYEMQDGILSLKELNQESKSYDEGIYLKSENKNFDVEEHKEKPQEVKEERKTGNISKKVYKGYMKAGGNYCTAFFLLLMFVLTQSGASGADFFLAFWVNLQTCSNRDFFTHQVCIYIYVGVIVSTIIVSIVRSISFFKFCMNASETLHSNMFLKVIAAPMRFFNMNPSGRILNRFSKDIGLIDETLPTIIMDTFQIAFIVLGSTLLITMLYPWMLLPTVIIVIFFYFFRKVYLATSRNLKRLEAINRSPIYSHMTASLSGLTTIRSFNVQDIVKNEFDHYQDLHSSVFYLFMACNRAFGFWLDMNCVFYSIIVIASVMLIDTPVGNVGLVITQSINLLGVFQWGIKQWSELENQMINVERVMEYGDMVPEKSLEDTKPPLKNWPINGHIKFDSVSLKYSHFEPPVLDHVTFEVQAKEKIGIVGRTGAGKSSLITALFRLFNSEGQILIDGINAAQIPLSNLRSKISIIPQESILFTGTLRDNLDPFNEFTDDKLWTVLEQVELRDAISDLPNDLYSELRESGSNFSVGQKQLLCLARAILRDNKIIILDEATANVDANTDRLIQTTIRNNFSDCTVLTIAHRLHTVVDSDKVLVLDAGKVAEFDHPFVLLQNPDSLFTQLVKETGKEMTEALTSAAKENYEHKKESN